MRFSRRLSHAYTAGMMSPRLRPSLVVFAVFALLQAAAGTAAQQAPAAAARAPTPGPSAGTAAPSSAELLLAPRVLRAFDEELSGALMRDHVAHLAAIHRVPATPAYHEAAEWVMARAKAYGLSHVHVEAFPGDGRTWFGTMRGNRGWRVEGGELSEVSPPGRRSSFAPLSERLLPGQPRRAGQPRRRRASVHRPRRRDAPARGGH
jgi:hypothetical protein